MTPKNKTHLERALRIMPWGTQTNAKRTDRDGMDHRPPFIDHASGCRMWDLDGREFIDYRAALGPILLGYCYGEIDEAVRKQIDKGVLFSMASPIEAEAAEEVLQTIGWAEQIRFMKSGVDACTCCIRLARSHTGRDHILTVGYHGYHDWFALGWPKPGVPDALRPFVHEITYGDCEAADRVFAEHGHELAAAIVVPVEWHRNPDQAFLAHLRQRCTEHGAALVFDEVLTGFRLEPAGAAGWFGITPDMAAYAKSFANGYPLSAFAGSREWMETLNQTIITTTYAGETLSLAAVCAVMKLLRREPVHEHLFRLGSDLRKGFEEIFRETGFPASTVGIDLATVIDFSPAGEEAETLHQRLFNALYDRGIFANEQWFITYSHQEADIAQTLEAMRECVHLVLD